MIGVTGATAITLSFVVSVAVENILVLSFFSNFNPLDGFKDDGDS